MTALSPRLSIRTPALPGFGVSRVMKVSDTSFIPDRDTTGRFHRWPTAGRPALGLIFERVQMPEISGDFAHCTISIPVHLNAFKSRAYTLRTALIALSAGGLPMLAPK